MVKLIIVIGWKYFSNYVAQSNYWVIQTKLLTALFKNIIEIKKYNKFVKTQKWFLWLNFWSFIKGQTSGTLSDSKWQQMTASDNE